MYMRIYIALMALPLYLYNAGINVVSDSTAPNFTNDLLGQSAVAAQHRNTQINVIASRDQQPEDCLRSRGCQI